MKLSRTAALALAACSPAILAAAPPATPPVPADIAAAYDHPVIAEDYQARQIVVAPGERYAVYAVHATSNPVESQRGYFLSNGSPLTSDGSALWIVDLKSKASHTICPATGAAWDASFSPDGKSLAFYSDRTGTTRLWVYDVAIDRCRQLSDTPIKSTYFPFEQPRWSPDGKSIYVSIWPSAGPGVAEIATRPLDVGRPPQADATGVTVLRHDPAGDGKTAAADTAPQTFEQRCAYVTYLAASLAVVPATGGPATTLVDDVTASEPARGAMRHHPSPYFKLSPSGRWISYYSTACDTPGQRFKTNVDLYIVPVTGGTPIRVASGLRPAGGGTEFDWGYRWHPREDALVYFKDNRLWRVRIAADGSVATEEIGKGLGPMVPQLLRFTADGSAAIVGVGATTQDRAKPVELARVPFDGGAPVRLAVGNADLTVRALPATADDAAWQQTSGAVTASAFDEKSGDTVMLGFDFAAGRVTPLWRGAATLNGPVPVQNGLLTVYEDFATPPNLMRISTDWRGREKLSNVAPGLALLHPGTVEGFTSTIPLGDGTLKQVHSTIILPPGAKRGDKLPTIVWFYPGSNYNRVVPQYGAPGMNDLAHVFTAHGYAVLLLDMPMGPGDQKGNVISEIMDDLVPQVRAAIDLGYSDPNRLALRGQSFGGFATVAVLTRTNMFRAAIASSGLYDLGGYYGTTYFVRGDLLDNGTWLETGQPRLGASLWDDPARYTENSPYYFADRIRTPLLILQGTNDPVGFIEGPKLFAALRRLDRPVELALYDGANHSPPDFRAPQAQDQAMRVLAFLDEHLKADRQNRDPGR